MAYRLEHMRAGMPVVAFETADLEADSWAALATPIELESYLKAILRCLSVGTLALNARKRLFAALWVSFSQKDQQAFLARLSDEVAA